MLLKTINITAADSEAQDEQSIEAIVQSALSLTQISYKEDVLILSSYPRPKRKKFLRSFENRQNVFIEDSSTGIFKQFNYLFSVHNLYEEFVCLVQNDFSDERFYTLFSASKNSSTSCLQEIMLCFEARIKNPGSFKDFLCQICFPEGWAKINESNHQPG